MEIKRISIFNEFKCIGKDCQANCCRNIWKIPIDPEMCTKYRNEKGIWGLLLRCSTVKRRDMTTFRNTFRGCPFWGTDHLCRIQKKHGVSYMPMVCIQFPRQLYNLEFFCEETLYLTCPESSRLFLTSAVGDRPFAFTVTEGNVSYKVNTTNDDRKFLDDLLKARDELITMLESGISYD
ncbi:MAG: flagellin lysine-N-methylase, partial [Lachnospiraceae bacterium]|nr:flagellin lysine-N-methylase [Lachnospiraceae bacterium]